MNYTKNIEIYKIIENFKTPTASNPSECAKCGIGDLLLIFDDEVWIKNWSDIKNEYVKAIYSPEFVRINLAIFEKV